MIGEEILEWGVLPCFAPVVLPVEDCNTRAEDENEADHNQAAIQFDVADIESSKRSPQSELQVTVPVEHSQPTCPVVDMTQEDSVSEAGSDSDLAPFCVRPEASESDTESMRLPAQRGCSGGGDLLWRTRWHRSAVKAEQRCQPTCSCETRNLTSWQHRFPST